MIFLLSFNQLTEDLSNFHVGETESLTLVRLSPSPFFSFFIFLSHFSSIVFNITMKNARLNPQRQIPSVKWKK